ncbi:hypothetical protein GUITHDRAFT_121484 [Guillardia theta CCMP2712]|uniref:Uncharacterized protein n=1 Tax=Guillardia theta (strain CCMP2712) TaxID=905079 RepID=L1I803_GUITC|nr:hypothetical protein GUITHDRAFT_121484 [Guillardia theta CCMP2712]EKX32343.1 hypothetical protein GUITHDRAFT_121484 [Guillardia theta CCMP2712]|eukprot:XP_005819323.1 hypothetical protein GUITHDRAFT_121484 [Guillardia theta CCMP2712]
MSRCILDAAYNAESDTAYNADSDGMDDNCPSVDVNEDKASIHLLRKHKKLWCREKGVIDCLLVEQEQSDSARGWNSEEDARSEESSWEQRSTSSEIAHGSRHDSDEIAYDSRHDKDAADGVIENIDDESLGLIIDGLQVVDSDPEASCVSEDQSDALLAVRGSGPEEQEESIKQS